MSKCRGECWLQIIIYLYPSSMYQVRVSITGTYRLPLRFIVLRRSYCKYYGWFSTTRPSTVYWLGTTTGLTTVKKYWFFVRWYVQWVLVVSPTTACHTMQSVNWMKRKWAVDCDTKHNWKTSSSSKLKNQIAPQRQPATREYRPHVTPS